MTCCWQKFLNAGDYHGALQSQGRPLFTPGDGSWSEFLMRHLYYTEKCEMDEEEFLSRVSECHLSVQQHDVYWKCYVDLCRCFQQPIHPCVYHAEFWRMDPRDYARCLAQRGDIEGINIVSHYFHLDSNWEWIELLPCTLEPRVYLHLIPWKDQHVEEQLVKHIRKHYEHTGQVLYCLIDAALEYLAREKTWRLKALREEYDELRLLEAEAEVENSLDNELETQTPRVNKQASSIQSIVGSIQSFLDASNGHSNDAVSYREYLQDLRACLQTLGDEAQHSSGDPNEITLEKEALRMERLQSHVTRLQRQEAESQEKLCGSETENARQVSFSSIESLEFSDDSLTD